MTLGRQLFFAFIFIISVVIVGAFLISVKNTYDYLGAQLESNAHDAAVSLGMSLSSIVDENDALLVERTVDSIFDGGYYSQIRVQSHNGKTNINKQAPTKIEGIPDWFIDLMPLEPPVMKALVMGGWTEWGVVLVRSNSGYAHEQLWNSFVNNLTLALVVIVITMGVISLLLKLMLTPLKLIEDQANAISNRDFPVIKLIPKTREFRNVVLAMNKMTSKLIQMVTEQSEVADNLRKEAYTDPLTGLGNRRSFLMRLDQITKEGDDTHYAAVGILRVENMEAINRDYGFDTGNTVFKRIATELTDNADHRTYLAKFNSVFGIFIQHTTESEIDEFAKMLMSKIAALRFGSIDHVEVHLGISIYHGEQDTKSLLSAADLALRAAEQKGMHGYHVLSEDKTFKIKGGEEWRDEIKAIIADEKIELVYQPVSYFDDKESPQFEALARLIDHNGQVIPAGIVFPMAERYRLTTSLDKIITQKVFSDLGKDWSHQSLLNVNLSIQSIIDPEFQEWLDKLVNNHREQAKRLVIEITEQQYHRNSEQYIEFLARFRSYGIRFSIDQFGINSTAFGFLQHLKIDQLKVDGSYVSKLHENRVNQFFLRSMTDIAHNLDIKIVANFVEQEEELKSVVALGMDGAQGYYIGEPESRGD